MQTAMLSAIRRQLLPQIRRQQRAMSQAATTPTSAAGTSLPQTEAGSSTSLSPKSYFVPRNKQGNLPVYSNVLNKGSRYRVLIRNVEGNLLALEKDLSQTLFAKGSYEAQKMGIQPSRGRKHLIIMGGNSEWKMEVKKWLQQNGF